MRDIVRDAALLMDEKIPGWWRRIDLSTLDIASGCNCVLGQTVGWTPGRIALFGSEARYYEYLYSPVRPWIGNAFLGPEPTEHWVHEILMRRATESVLEGAVEAPSVPVQPVSAPGLSSEPSEAPEAVLEVVWATL